MSLGEVGDLFARARVGMPEAARTLFQVCGRRVHATVRAAGLRGQDLDDAVQDVLLAVQKAVREGGPSRESFVAWLLGVVRNVLADHYRRSDPSRSSRLPDDLLDLAAPDPVDAAIRAEFAAALREMVGRLPEDLAAAVALAHLDDLDAQEVAPRLGITANAVYVRLYKGRTLLRTWLRRFAD